MKGVLRHPLTLVGAVLLALLGIAGYSLATRQPSRAQAAVRLAESVAGKSDPILPMPATLPYGLPVEDRPGADIVGNARVYVDFLPDTDVIFRPYGETYQTIIVIRGKPAPESFKFTFSPEPKTKLVSAKDGTIRIQDDLIGRTYLGLSKPRALNPASRRSYKPSFTLKQNVVTLHVAHRQSDAAYPIVAELVSVDLPEQTFHERLKHEVVPD